MRIASLSLLVLLAACRTEVFLEVVDKEVPLRPDPPTLGPVSEDVVLGQVIPEEIDVLWVIDDSCSMLNAQRDLSANSAAYLDAYRSSGLDWHVGVITTNMRDEDHEGRLQMAAGYKWVDPTVPDPTSVFQAIAVVGNRGPVVERGRDAAWHAFNSPSAIGWNKGFIRPDAQLSVIFVTDENDDSDRLDDDPIAEGLPSEEPNLEEFVDWLYSLKPDPEMITVAAVASIDGRCSPLEDHDNDDTTPEVPDISQLYIDMIDMVGGALFDVCGDWEEILDDLANLDTGLSRIFYLPRLPDPETIHVWVEDDGRVFEFTQDVDYDYLPIKNAIEFRNYTPRARADVHVTYDVLESSGGR